MNARQPPAALAIDPGHTGAVAVVGGTTLLTWAAWRKTRRRSEPYDIAADGWRGGTSPCLSHALRVACVHLRPDVDILGAVCAVEGIEPHGKRAGYTALAEAAGQAVAVVYGIIGSPLRPRPREWVPATLGVPANQPFASYSLAGWGWGADPDAGSSRGASRYPMGRGVVACSEPPAWARDHVADAAWMAVWAGVQKTLDRS